MSLLLKCGKQNFAHTIKHLGTDDDIVFSKGVYHYSYMSSRYKFAETQLPPIEAFHDNLKKRAAEAGGLHTCSADMVAIRHIEYAAVS